MASTRVFLLLLLTVFVLVSARGKREKWSSNKKTITSHKSQRSSNHGAHVTDFHKHEIKHSELNRHITRRPLAPHKTTTRKSLHSIRNRTMTTSSPEVHTQRIRGEQTSTTKKPIQEIHVRRNQSLATSGQKRLNGTKSQHTVGSVNSTEGHLKTTTQKPSHDIQGRRNESIATSGQKRLNGTKSVQLMSSPSYNVSHHTRGMNHSRNSTDFHLGTTQESHQKRHNDTSGLHNVTQQFGGTDQSGNSTKINFANRTLSNQIHGNQSSFSKTQYVSNSHSNSSKLYGGTKLQVNETTHNATSQKSLYSQADHTYNGTNPSASNGSSMQLNQQPEDPYRRNHTFGSSFSNASHDYSSWYQPPQSGNTHVNFDPVTNVDNNPGQNTYHYTSKDYGYDDFGFYLGYALDKASSPQVEEHHHHYDHYVVHHYHHNRNSVPKQVSITSNAVVECPNGAAFCSQNTDALCLSNGTIMCVAKPQILVPCPGASDKYCVKSVIPNLNSTDSATKIIHVPCVSNATIHGGTVNFSLVASESSILYCVTVIAEPAVKKPDALVLYDAAKKSLFRFITRAFGV